MAEEKKMTLEEFKDYIHSMDIVDVLSAADFIDENDVHNRKILCPFHEEDSPSLNFYEDSYYCFGCTNGGDAITFVQNMEDCSFLKACQLLAAAHNKELQVSTNPFMNFSRDKEMKKKMASEWEQYKKDMDDAPQWVKDGAKIFFPLPVGWDKKMRYYVLCYTSKTGEPLAFTKRRGFELKDPKDKSKYPKWKHSLKDNSCIALCNNVYNLETAVKPIRTSKSAIVVEGPKDCIPFILSNHKNVVAVSGVSHMEKAVETLPECNEMTLAFDSDVAGDKGRLSYAIFLSDTMSLDNIYGYNFETLDPYDYYQEHKKLPERKKVVELLTKEELHTLYNNTTPYNQELVVRELMHRESLSHAQALSFFSSGKAPKKRNVKSEIERLEKEGDEAALRKLKIKYGL